MVACGGSRVGSKSTQMGITFSCKELISERGFQGKFQHREHTEIKCNRYTQAAGSVCVCLLLYSRLCVPFCIQVHCFFISPDFHVSFYLVAFFFTHSSLSECFNPTPDIAISFTHF